MEPSGPFRADWTTAGRISAGIGQGRRGKAGNAHERVEARFCPVEHWLEVLDLRPAVD